MRPDGRILLRPRRNPYARPAPVLPAAVEVILAPRSSVVWPAAAIALWSAAVACYFWRELPIPTAFALACVALASAAIASRAAWLAYREAARDRAFRAEWARARSEWPTLRDGAAEANACGQPTEAFLRERGYTIEGVIRAIAHDLALPQDQ